ncbi:helix-turn-helix transcriptional regulator [Actinoallomurus soli]|uniref:helix-turn-helix transcriptional regulator n=1 Tax=Actinoallomurus soli TaxID=2952535 RepID=UPI002092179B|nr:LuxR C-terminal-related transcriptional regulator [Actinoallomurus soli]MCO5971630.1 LuxR C-terminal-related transcriptional regulator [Actinoallomurus soli]
MFTTSAAGPVRLGDADPLRPADYRRLFAVLDDVIEAGDIHVFRRTLLVSLARHFGWTTATIRPASAEKPSPPPVSAARGADGVIAVRIDAGTAGAEYLVVAFEEGTAGDLERAILNKLARQLAPLLQRHLTRCRHGENRASLTKREVQISDLVAGGLSNGEIARELHVSIDTVKKHLTHIFAKTGCASRTQLALFRSGGREGKGNVT